MRPGRYKGGGWRRHSGGGGSYISPFYPTVLYSLRKRNAAYTGPCIRVKRSSDGATSDIGFFAGDYVDSAALLAFVGPSSNGDVVIWYDQGGGHVDASDPTGVQIVTGGNLVTRAGQAAMVANISGSGWSAAANSAFAFGTGAYTLEYISQPNGSNNGVGQVLIDFRDPGGSAVAAFYNQGGNSPSLFDGANNSGGLGDVVVNVTAWEAVSSTGTNLSLYYAGNRDYSATRTSAYVGNRPLSIGRADDGSLTWLGYFLEVRITKGAAIYSGATVVPPDYYA